MVAVLLLCESCDEADIVGEGSVVRGCIGVRVLRATRAKAVFLRDWLGLQHIYMSKIAKSGSGYSPTQFEANTPKVDDELIPCRLRMYITHVRKGYRYFINAIVQFDMACSGSH